MTYLDKARQRVASWVHHSGKTRDEMAAMAGVDLNVIRRLRAGLPISMANFDRVERSIPKNWRDPLPETSDAA